MKFFSLLTAHTDAEFSELLNNKSGEGYRLGSVRGNLFHFVKNENGKSEYAVRSFCKNRKKDVMADEVASKCTLYRQEGWNAFLISSPETVSDSRRHIFLERENSESPVPEMDARLEYGARFRALKKTILSVLTCGVFFSFCFFLFYNDFLRLATDWTLLLSSVSFFAATAICFALSLASLLHLLLGKRRYNRFLDLCVLFLFVQISLSAVFLVFSSFFDNSAKPVSFVYTDRGKYSVYDDRLPLALEDFGFAAGAEYRNSRFSFSDGAFGNSTTLRDESFDLVSSDTYGKPKIQRKSFLLCTKIVSSNAIVQSHAIKHLPRSPLRLYGETGNARIHVSDDCREFLFVTDTSVLYVVVSESSDPERMHELVSRFLL